jgi:N-acyl homoserine lactone hydrolase
MRAVSRSVRFDGRPLDFAISLASSLRSFLVRFFSSRFLPAVKSQAATARTRVHGVFMKSGRSLLIQGGIDRNLRAGILGGVRLERLIAGWFTVPAGIVRRDDDFERPVRCPVPVYLIETETERILVDTGLNPAGVADPAARYGSTDAFGPFAPEQDESIADQLDLGTLTMVVLTHLHFDHVGGLELVPSGVPIVIQRAEWDAGQDESAVARNFFQPRDYSGADRELRLVDGDHDLLGDGSVELLLTPGHTPGHQSVRAGEVVIGGDVTHFAVGLDDLRLPIFGDDLDAQARSAGRLRGLRDSGLTVLPGHDAEVLAPGPVLPSTR